jgi:hypothetical protein
MHPMQHLRQLWILEGVEIAQIEMKVWEKVVANLWLERGLLILSGIHDILLGFSSSSWGTLCLDNS